MSANMKDKLGPHGLIHNPEGEAQAGCMLYTRQDETSREALELLLKHNIAVWECDISSNDEPYKEQDIPLAITPGGECRGIDSIKWWIEWIVLDHRLPKTKRYQKRTKKNAAL